MKSRNFLWVVLFTAVSCFIGCSTLTPRTKAIPYAFGENTNGTAEIEFGLTRYYRNTSVGINSLKFIEFEGKQLPPREEGTHWFPLQFPAGRELNLKVLVEGRRGIESVYYQVIFNCPPLVAGKKYRLWGEEDGKSRQRLILTYGNVEELKWYTRRIHTQQITTRDVPYIFGENTNRTAEIIFMRRIRFVDFEGEQLPSPEIATLWYPFRFPSGRDLNIRVYVSYYGSDGDRPGFRRRGMFRCPPLEAGRTYKLWYESVFSGGYYSGSGRLILTYSDVTSLEYSFGKPKYHQVYVQEIPPLTGTAE